LIRPIKETHFLFFEACLLLFVEVLNCAVFGTFFAKVGLRPSA
jgi:hypothetical protein